MRLELGSQMGLGLTLASGSHLAGVLPLTWQCHIIEQGHPRTGQPWGFRSPEPSSFLLTRWSEITRSSLLKNLGQGQTPHPPYLLEAPVIAVGVEYFC